MALADDPILWVAVLDIAEMLTSSRNGDSNVANVAKYIPHVASVLTDLDERTVTVHFTDGSQRLFGRI